METKIENREPRKRHELAFKRDCVALLAKSGKSLKAFAAEMGPVIFTTGTCGTGGGFTAPRPRREVLSKPRRNCCGCDAKSRACGRRGTS